MNDNELLELAAKAAGIEVTAVLADGIPHRFGGGYWNPLTDDGDALRLAVRLGISLEIDSIHCDDPEVAVIAYGDEVYRASLGSDSYVATRRAIVRAAAEIGRAMP